MNDLSAQQRAALATVALLIEGPQRARELAHRLYDNEEGSFDLLNNIGGVLPVVNDRGWWYVDTGHLSAAPELLHVVSARIDETCVGMAYCRPLLRADMVALRTLLQHLIKIGTVPD